jgi:hypothetical protein
VTGATAGIGNAFARALAARGDDLVLVARDGERLAQLAAELRATCGVEVEVLQADLVVRDQLERVVQRLRDPGPGSSDGRAPIDLLVNNAGFASPDRLVVPPGKPIEVHEKALHDQEQMLDVLVRAVLVLTHAALPGMVARGRGCVVNVSSVAGFLNAGPYSAAKAWVTTFTLSLAGELAGTGVTATALCPGYVRTEFHQRMGVARSGPSWAWLDADRLVREALRDVDRGRVISIPSRRYALAATFARHLPVRLSGGVSRNVAARRGNRL